MDEKNVRLNIKNILEDIFVILLASIPFVNVIFDGKIVNIILFALCMITIVTIILNRKISIEYIFLSLILLVLILYKTYTKEIRIEMEFILFIIAILTLRKGKVDRILRIYFITQLILYITVVILNKIGIIESLYFYRNTNGIMIKRNSLGFNHPNIAYRIYFNILITYLLIRNKNIKTIELIVSLIISAIMYISTDSRNGIICSILVLGLVFIFRNKNIEKYISISKYLFYIFFAISFIVTNFYDSSILIFQIINKSTSNRLFAINMYLDKIGFSFLGQAKIIEHIAFDNFYMYIFCLFGLISVIIYGIYYKKLFEVLIQRKVFIGVLVTITVLIYGLFESSIMYPYSNITLLLIPLIYNAKNRQ